MDVTTAQSWRAVKHAWMEYRAARFFENGIGMLEAAVRIRLLQERLGDRRSDFSELGITWPYTLDAQLG